MSETMSTPTFQEDLAFIEQHTGIVLLKEGTAAVAVAPAYQGRVMTSTTDLKNGPSFGWINRPVIEAGLKSEEDRKGTLEEHIYIFGGEERFWLGPEGGQFALYFKPGTPFEFSDWFTPPAIDTDAFVVSAQSENSATFEHAFEVQNYHGITLSMGVKRTVSLLGARAVEDLLQVALPSSLQIVGYETDNQLTNAGENAWTPETGLPSIWMLGMYNPSPTTIMVIPFLEGPEEELGPKVNDTYFGKVPEEHLRVENDVLFFKGDGTRRGKIGISPRRSKGLAGSYDAEGQVLTVVMHNRQPAPHGFVNSMWEIQEDPFSGDVINAYNDGSPEPGAPPLGPFFELETSSPAAALAPGETMTHIQRTLHLQGEEEDLDPVARGLFGVSLEDIKKAFV